MYLQQQLDLRRELAAQDRHRYRDPHRNPQLDRYWVVYVWRDGQWLLAGFSRPYRSIKRMMRRARRRCRIERHESAKFVPLAQASRVGPCLEEPQRHPSLRPQFFADTPAPPQPIKRQRSRRRQKPLASFTKTDYAVFGAMTGTARAYVYLGPLQASNRRDAKREARRMFSLYPHLVVEQYKKFSPNLRYKLRSCRLVAGVSLVALDKLFPNTP